MLEPEPEPTFSVAARYFASIIILVTCSCLLTILTLHVHHKGAGGLEVPEWVRVLVLDWLGRLLFMHSLRYKEMKQDNTVRV